MMQVQKHSTMWYSIIYKYSDMHEFMMCLRPAGIGWLDEWNQAIIREIWKSKWLILLKVYTNPSRQKLGNHSWNMKI